MRKFLFLIFLASLFLTQTTFAARSISITSDKVSLFGDDEMNISASVSGFTTGEKIYIKSAFYQDGSTNYFGFTKNNDSWIKNGASSSDQRQVEIGSWDNKLVSKVDFSDTGYKGKGSYKFKLGFYYTTSGGNLSSVNWSDSISVDLDSPNPTDTPTKTVAPQAVSKAVAIAAPTSTLKITSIPSSIQNTQTFAKIPSDIKVPEDYTKEDITPKYSPSQKTDVLGAKENNIWVYTLIAGLFFICVVGIWLGIKYRNIIELWIKK